MAAPEYSVIINTIGSEYLEKVVGEFLCASAPLEIIIVIDKPGLRPEMLLSETSRNDPRVKFIVNAQNLGPSKSANIGIAASSGRIILRNDDDDIPAPGRIAETGAFFDKNPETDIIFSYATGKDVESARTWFISGPTDDTDIKNALLKRNFIVHSTVAFKRSSLQKIGFYDETFTNAADYDLYLRCIRAGFVFGCIPKALVTRLYHRNSITVANRGRQILHSMAARLLHVAQTCDSGSAWPVLFRYALLLAIPDWARTFRRKIGRGT